MRLTIGWLSRECSTLRSFLIIASKESKRSLLPWRALIALRGWSTTAPSAPEISTQNLSTSKQAPHSSLWLSLEINNSIQISFSLLSSICSPTILGTTRTTGIYARRAIRPSRRRFSSRIGWPTAKIATNSIRGRSGWIFGSKESHGHDLIIN